MVKTKKHPFCGLLKVFLILRLLLSGKKKRTDLFFAELKQWMRRVTRESLKPGDHIYSWRTAYIYAHHGSLSSLFYFIFLFHFFVLLFFFRVLLLVEFVHGSNENEVGFANAVNDFEF